MAQLGKRFHCEECGTEILCRLYLAAGAHGVFPQLPGFEEVHDERDIATPRARSSFAVSSCCSRDCCTSFWIFTLPSPRQGTHGTGATSSIPGATRSTGPG